MKTSRSLTGLFGVAALALGHAGHALANTQLAALHTPRVPEAVRVTDVVVEPRIQIQLASYLAIAWKVIRDASALVNSTAISGPGKAALAQLLDKATAVLGNAAAIVGASPMTKAGAVSVVKALAEVSTIIDKAREIASSNAVEGPGWSSLVKLLAKASTAVGDATAAANAAAH